MQGSVDFDDCPRRIVISSINCHVALNFKALRSKLKCVDGKYKLVRMGVGVTGRAPVGVIIRCAHTKSAVRE